jgi:hypothetical protein
VTDERARIVKRVVRALDESEAPDSLVWSYFESDREALVEATRQTLEATREDASPERIDDALERELVEALRYPARTDRGVLPHLWVHRRAWATGVVTLIAAALLVVFL